MPAAQSTSAPLLTSMSSSARETFAAGEQIAVLLPLPVLALLRRFIDWVAGYTVQPAGALLRIAINPARRWVPPAAATAITASGRSLEAAGLKPTAVREKIL